MLLRQVQLMSWNRRPRIAATNPQSNTPIRNMGGAMVLLVHSEGTGVLVPRFGLAPRALLTRRPAAFCPEFPPMACLPLDILQGAWQFCPVVSLGEGRCRPEGEKHEIRQIVSEPRRSFHGHSGAFDAIECGAG